MSNDSFVTTTARNQTPQAAHWIREISYIAPGGQNVVPEPGNQDRDP
jgi:hypothetical protein